MKFFTKVLLLALISLNYFSHASHSSAPTSVAEQQQKKKIKTEEEKLSEAMAILTKLQSRGIVGLPEELKEKVYEYIQEWKPVVRFESPGETFALALSVDNNMFVSSSDDNTIKIWERYERGNWLANPTAILRGHTGWVRSVALSTDKNMIVSGSEDKTVRVWTKKDSEWMSKVIGMHNEAITSVALSFDDRMIVSGAYNEISDDGIKIWVKDDQGEWSNSVILTAHTGPVNSIALSVDKSTIVSGSSDKTIRIWKQESPNVWRDRTFEMPDRVFSVALSADNDMIVAGLYDGTVMVLTHVNGLWYHEPLLLNHAGAVTSVALSADKRTIVSGSFDRTIRIWTKDEQGGWQSITLNGHAYRVRSIVLSVDESMIVSGSSDGSVIIWKKEKSVQQETIEELVDLRDKEQKE